MPKDRNGWFSELLVNVIDVSFLVINFDFALNAFKIVAELSLVEHFHQLKTEILAFETIFTYVCPPPVGVWGRQLRDRWDGRDHRYDRNGRIGGGR